VESTDVVQRRCVCFEVSVLLPMGVQSENVTVYRLLQVASSFLPMGVQSENVTVCRLLQVASSFLPMGVQRENVTVSYFSRW
jgi:hypothetical protein